MLLYGKHPFVGFLLEDLQGLENDFLRLVLAKGLDVELENIYAFAQVNLIYEFFVSDALSAGRAFPLISDNSGHVLDIENAHWAKFFEFNCIIPFDWLLYPDIW